MIMRRSTSKSVTTPAVRPSSAVPRAWLMGSTALVAGAFGAAGFVMLPNAALASGPACIPGIDPNSYVCVGTDSSGGTIGGLGGALPFSGDPATQPFIIELDRLAVR